MFKKKSAANSIIKLMDENLNQNIESFKKDAKKASHEGSKGIAFTFTEINRSTYEAAIYGNSYEEWKSGFEPPEEVCDIISKANRNIHYAFEKWIESEGFVITSLNNNIYFIVKSHIKFEEIGSEIKNWEPTYKGKKIIIKEGK